MAATLGLNVDVSHSVRKVSCDYRFQQPVRAAVLLVVLHQRPKWGPLNGVGDRRTRRAVVHSGDEVVVRVVAHRPVGPSEDGARRRGDSQQGAVLRPSERLWGNTAGVVSDVLFGHSTVRVIRVEGLLVGGVVA